MKPKLFYIKEPVFNSGINFFINYTFESLNKELKRGGAEPLGNQYENVKGLSFADEHENTFYFYIWIPKLKWDLHGQCLLNHEISHSVLSIMEHKGIEIRPARESANETFCYLLEYYLYHACAAIGLFYEKKENRK